MIPSSTSTRIPAIPKRVVLPVKQAAAEHQRASLARYRRKLRDAGSEERLAIESEGVPAEQVLRLLDTSGLTRVDLERFTGLSEDAINTRLAGRQSFDGSSGLAILGLIDVFNAVERLASMPDGAAGETTTTERLAAAWLRAPHPSLDRRHPGELMGTPGGRQTVLGLIS